MRNAGFFDMTRNRFRTGLAELDRKWGWYFALGVFLIVLGAIAGGSAVTTTFLSVVVLGWIVVGACAGLMILSFLTGKWSGFLLTMAAGILALMAGITDLTYPLSSAVAINLIIGTLLIAAGIFRSLASIIMRFPSWGWSLVSGIAAI